MNTFTAYSLSIFAFLFSVFAFFITVGTPEFTNTGAMFGWLWAIYYFTIFPLERLRSNK